MAGERCKRCGWILAPARHLGSPRLCPPCLHALKSQQAADTPIHAWIQPPSDAVRQLAIKQVLRTVAIHLGIAPSDPDNVIVGMAVRGYQVHISKVDQRWVATAHHSQGHQTYIARADHREEVLTAIARLVDEGDDE